VNVFEIVEQCLQVSSKLLWRGDVSPKPTIEGSLLAADSIVRTDALLFQDLLYFCLIILVSLNWWVNSLNTEWFLERSQRRRSMKWYTLSRTRDARML
jgi:hypothetical protein